MSPTASDRGWHAAGAAVGSGWACFRGRTGDNDAHAHHAIQLAVGLSAPVAAEVDGRTWRGPGLLIDTGVRHRLLPSTGDAELIYLDPEHALGPALCASLNGPVTILREPVARRLASASGGCGENLIERLSAALALRPPTHHHPDERIAAVLRWIDDNPGLALSAPEAARLSRLSTAQFSRRFRRQVGLPLRPYLRWRRLLLAIASVASGTNLTRAAADAGFSDSAHLSRTVRRHFGIPARTLLALGLHGAAQQD